MALPEAILVRFEAGAYNVNSRIFFDGEHPCIICVVFIRRANVQCFAEDAQSLGAQRRQIPVIILGV